MARVRWSTIVGEARGTIGPTTFIRTHAGSVARRLIGRRVSASELQLLARAQLRTISELWRSPSMWTFRYDWIFLASGTPYIDIFGDTRFFTGSNLFTKCNRNRQTLGLAPILQAPAVLAVGNPGSITLTYDPGPPERLELTTSTGPVAGEAAVIKALRPTSQGVTIPPNSFKIIQTLYPAPAQPWDILPSYITKFRQPEPNEKLFVTVHFVTAATGWASPPALDGIIWP